MTLTLSPEAEAHLAAVAAQRRLSPEDALAQVLAEARADFDDATTNTEDSLDDALQEAYAQTQSGHSQSLATFADGLRARFDARHPHPVHTPNKAA